MAIAATIEWDIRTGGADTNGGGFKAGASGTDWTQQNAAQYSVTDGVTAGTTTITSVTAAFGTDVVGNLIYVSGGTGAITADWYEITARASSTSITVDRSTGLTAGTGVTLKIGGAMLTMSAVEPKAIAGNKIHIKAGTYGETLTLTISGGNATPRVWEGYNATHGDAPEGTNRPLIDGASTRANCINTAAIFGNEFRHIRVSGATAVGIVMSSGNMFYYNCKSSSNGTHGWACTGAGAIRLIRCEASSNVSKGVDAASTGASLFCYGSDIHDNSGTGVSSTGLIDVILVNCILDSNTGSNISIAGGSFINCTIFGAIGATADGLVTAAVNARQTTVLGCISKDNGRYGFNRATASSHSAFFVFDYNGYHGNSTAGLNNITAGTHDLTTDPSFTNGASADFSIGTAYKAAGWPGVFPAGTSTGYMDIGAVQRQEAGAAGGLLVHPGMVGGMRG